MGIVQTTGAEFIGACIQEVIFSGLLRLSRILRLCSMDKPRRSGVPAKALRPDRSAGEHQSGESHTLVFEKAIDIASSPGVRKGLLSALASHQHLIIDFTHLPYIDSAGIAVFLEALKIAKQQNRSMAFVGVQGSALQLMTLTRLNQVFTLLDSAPDIHVPLDLGGDRTVFI